MQAQGVGDAADAQLNGGAIGDHCGDDMPDGLSLRLGLDGHNLQKRLVVFHDGIDFGDVEQGFPEDSRHVAIDLDQKFFTITGGGGDIVVDGPKAEKPGLVHG